MIALTRAGCARTTPPLKGGPPLLAGTHTDLPAHTQTCRRTHRAPTNRHQLFSRNQTFFGMKMQFFGAKKYFIFRKKRFIVFIPPFFWGSKL
jgi:hypothetical protein